MKYIILFSLIFINKVSFGQSPAVGADIYRPELDKFVGTWKFTNANQEIIFMFKKVHYYSNGLQMTEDVLMGSINTLKMEW
jgi:hypothetical protein